MLYRLRENISLLVTVSLFLTGCRVSSGAAYNEPDGSPGNQTSAQPAPSPNSGVTNMEMPSRASTRKESDVKAAPNQVVIENFSFVPASLTVKAGTKVTWINKDDVPHTATDTDKRFNSKTLDTDDQFSFTFQQPGTYNYYCALHPKMTAQIIVK